MSEPVSIGSERELRVFESFLSTWESFLPQGGERPFGAFARDRLWIKTKEGRVIPFVLNAVQRRYLAAKRLARLRRRPQRFLLLKYRRGGFTTLEQGQSYRAVATRRNMTCLTLADIAERTLDIFKIAQLMFQRDPQAPYRKGVGNSYRLQFPLLNSEFLLATAAARAPGRGMTLQRVHGSEVSRWCPGPNQVESQKEIIAGLDEAASHGEMVLETTPRGYEHFRELWVRARRGENQWTPIFIPWFDDRSNAAALDDGEGPEIMKGLTQREAQLVQQHGLDAGQIKWRRAAQIRLGPRFPEEYPEDDETCFLSSGQSYFDVRDVNDLLEALPDYTRSPFYRPESMVFCHHKQVRGGLETMWEPPKPDEHYVLGADTSEGLPESDYNGFGILKSTGEQVYEMHGRWRPPELAAEIVRAAKLYNGALVGIEVNNHGHAVVQKVVELGWAAPQTQLYYRDFDGGDTGKAGWSTDARTRPVMISDLEEAIRTRAMRVRDRRLLAECIVFTRQQDGSYSAASGYNDDSVMKWAIAWQMRKCPRRTGRRVIGEI